MKVGVIGASGTVGRMLVRYLAADPARHTVRSLIRRPDAEIARVSQLLVSPSGVLDNDSLRRFVDGLDAVVNLAARNPTGQTRDLQDVSGFMAANAVGPAFVAAACAERDVPLLHFSTVAVYETHAYEAAVELDEKRALPNLDESTVAYFDEVSALVRACVDSGSSAKAIDRVSYPTQASVYGLSKLIGERVVVDSGANAVCVRLSDGIRPRP